MPEPITTVGLGAIAAYLGKDGIAKILGPTAEYLGGELQEFTRKRIENVGNIFKNAEEKLGANVEQPGSVPPKVLKTIINEGSYSDDDIAVEYFGGVLASSRSNISRDDRGARIAKTLDNLSSYQLRCHFLIYATVSHLLKGSSNSFSRDADRRKLELFMPTQEFSRAMGAVEEEARNEQLMPHIFHGLSSDGLITEHWAFGTIETLSIMNSKVKFDGPGAICTPTTKGVELFLWGFGLGSRSLDYVFSKDFSPSIEGMPEFVPGSRIIGEP